MIRRMAVSAGVAGGLLVSVAVPAASRPLETLTLRAKNCKNCVIGFGSLEADIYKDVQLRNGRGQVSLPLDAGWYGLSVTTKKGMSGGGAATLVVMNYAGFGMGDRVSNRQSRRSGFGTSCSYFFDSQTVRFVVKRDRLPKRYWGQREVGPWRKYLRAWASPQQDQTTRDLYEPTNKGQLASQNGNCLYEP